MHDFTAAFINFAVLIEKMEIFENFIKTIVYSFIFANFFRVIYYASITKKSNAEY